MTLIKQIAKHLRDVYFGDNWTSVNIKDTLADINWKEATAKVHNLNTIATLVFHVNYYVTPVLKVLQGDPLKASDKFADPKYGNFYRNLSGIIEHTYYHLGQISLIKKILRETKESI